MKFSLLDSFIGIFSPRAALRNHRARRAISAMRKYEGAGKGKKTKNWKTPNSSANTEIIADLQTLRDRSRDLVRNNGYAFGAIDQIESDMIGDGIIPKFTHKKKKKLAEECDSMFAEWADSKICDADGLHNFYGIQSLVARATAESGECLIKRVWIDGVMKMQVLEPDFLDTAKNESTSSRFILGGIEFNKKGQRVAYYLFDEHPGGSVTGKAKGESKRIDAKDIIPVFRADRPGQIRGVPWLAPCILTLRDFDEYEDAELTRQKLAACFAGYITKDLADDADDDSDDSDSVDLVQDIEPGLIQELGVGMDIKFTTPPQMQGIGEFSKVSLQRVAKGIGLPLEILSGNYSNINYSSGKLGFGQYRRNLRKWRSKFFIPQFCDGVWLWFVEYALLQGKDFSEITVSWTHPQPEPIDPLKENKADALEVEYGFSSVSEIIRRRGKDPEVVFQERADELKKMKELGIPIPNFGGSGALSEPEETEDINAK
ncbi:hypothetical protein Bb109J_c1962 [Bdellovibrio bacteriovorus]|uniref:phage portal protein n=1 Tax=Bdellovibrio bacteriovorus TaxID=959 RepID=UPI00045C0BEB|nr:phage portal protein [Bdellovibrio bacteriovorus]AHZ84651.1 hypothetical protein EP01_06835 [Bdellovibrio bacteriovorus]BEV68542.1 hypothetical protein Bb109J_c1962 [Bdellovibrio bacteriovorus]